MKPSPISQISKVCVLVPLLAVITAMAGSGCATKNLKTGHDASKAEVLPLVGTIQVHRYKLDNGLKVLVVEDHSSPTFAYQTWFRVGSRDENVGYTGLAHLFEHMMFKGTKSLKEGEFDRILEGAGAEGENAFTSRDYTAYVQEMPADKLDMIAKLESDRMLNLVVNDDSFKTEREVVQNERRFRTENSPDGLMYQEIFGLAFTKHSYHWPVIGYQEDLNRMSAANAVDFYKGYYSPNHATIIVVGDVKADAVHEMVKKYYGAFSPQQPPAPSIADEPEQKSARRKVLKLNIQVEKLMVGYHIPAITNADIPAIMALRGVLATGKSSRLQRALVETGIVSSVDAYDIDDKDPSLMLIGANLQKGKTATQAETIILREIARLSKELVSKGELDRAKNGLSFQFYQGLDNNHEKAGFLGRFETIANSFEDGVQKMKSVQIVTPEEIQRVTRKYFEPRNRSVIVGVKK